MSSNEFPHNLRSITEFQGIIGFRAATGDARTITSHITSARELRIGGKSNSCPKISSSLRSTSLVGDSVESRNSTEGNCIQSVDALTWLLRFSKLFVVLELFRQSCTQPDYTLRTCRTIAQLLAAL
ncbi:unnamed protein product [Aspergillus oryzae RIB40]|uniref:DNA, SC005 n=1 Tax=Aspergillus oryzae (strain ATCC 42149 / RIB 40) TaxID=510516 RepID=Q2UQH7_ASPOR|nr:unnamed protein product [Aspergillus oryzae RIB40]BAE56188.1 unnamed protein product [Aspergillus oryzae RIB40]